MSKFKDKILYKRTKKFIEKKNSKNAKKELKELDKVISIKDKKERYSYIHDLICDYLDDQFRSKNLCGFDCGMCKQRRAMKEKGIIKPSYDNGCCYSFKKRELCEYIDPSSGCKIRNIACKLYTCIPLKKEGYRFHLRDIYIARYFLNRRQKLYAAFTYFTPKDKIVDELIKRESIFGKWFL